MTNVLTLWLDDMRADGLNAMPNARRLMPCRFTNARAAGGACTDARMNLHTGTWAHNNPWPWSQTATQFDASKTWAPWLAAEGYTNALFGKFIAAATWPQSVPDGWSHWRGYAQSNPHVAFGYQVYDGTDLLAPPQRNLDYMLTELVDFIANATGPWMAHWAPQQPHTDTVTGALAPYPEAILDWSHLHWPVPVDEDVTGKPQWVQDLDPVTFDQVLDIRRAARQQYRVLAGVDQAIAVIFQALFDAAALNDTIVILGTDQGVHYGEHRFGNAFGVPAGVQKMTPYEPVVRMPFLVHGPGFPTGHVDVPVSQCDVTATAVAVAGATPAQPLDGVDLRDIVANPGAYDDRVTSIACETAFTVTPPYEGLQTGPRHEHPSLKYVRYPSTSEVELYDLAGDPGELVNLAGNPEWATAEAALEGLLDGMVT